MYIYVAKLLFYFWNFLPIKTNKHINIQRKIHTVTENKILYKILLPKVIFN